MRTGKLGIELIKHYEGFSHTVYLCAAGYPTIGYGHVVKKGEHYESITRDHAEVILKEDLKIAERAVGKLISVPLNQYEFDALVSFVFNLGAGALQRSTLRIKLNRSDYRGAANEFTKWVYAGGRKLRGLVRRREEERDLFLLGS